MESPGQIYFLYLLTGLLAGVFSGVFGIGGGLIMIPILVFFFHLTQHQAHGLSLAALLLPVGLLGAWTYYKASPFPLKPALFLAVGIFLGAYFGGVLANQMSAKALRIAFGSLMIVTGIKMVLTK